MSHSLNNSSIPPVALDVLEMWVCDFEQTKQTLTTMLGFTLSEGDFTISAEEKAALLTCGNVRLIVRQGTTAANRIASHVAKHGDSVADVVLVCDAVSRVVDRARAQGLKVSNENGCPRIDLLGDGTILHSLRDRPEAFRSNLRGQDHSVPMITIDHVTYCLPHGMMTHVAQLYREVFALENVQVENVGAEECSEFDEIVDGMRSIVLRSSLGFTVVLTEPRSSEGVGQIHRFLEVHAGAGVQHVAIAYKDLIAAAKCLSSNGVSFLSIPKEHLERSYQRFRHLALPWDALKCHDILVDADSHGLLYQLFTRPITARSSFFIEFIQRSGAMGFGSNNVRTLFAAVDAAIRDPTKPLWPTPESVHHSNKNGWKSELVCGARSRIAFYRDHLAGISGFESAPLPTFEKSKTIGYGRFPLSCETSRAHRVFATSGTSGHRLYVSLNKGEWNRTANWLEKVAQRVGLRREDVLLNTHCYGLWVGGPSLDLLANRVGAGVVPLGPIGPAIVLELLVEHVGTAISATPSYLRRLVETAQVTGVNLKNTSLRFGFIGAEPAEESLRRKLLSQLPKGFTWIELYGLTETGGPSVAFAPDPEAAELELNTQDFWAEVLDPLSDQPVPMGDVGELTITTRLTDGLTPLIRYRTRDLVRAIKGPPDAPTHISRILGRVDESLKIGGVLVYPSAIAEIMSEFLPTAAEWRAWVRRIELDDELLVEVEASQDLCQAVQMAFQERIGLSLTVISVESGTLARSRRKTQRIMIDSSTSKVPGGGARETMPTESTS